MSSPGFQADSAAMTRAVQGFEETATNAKSTMASLESELTEALRNYKGDQAVAFWDLQRRLQEKMPDVEGQRASSPVWSSGFEPRTCWIVDRAPMP